MLLYACISVKKSIPLIPKSCPVTVSSYIMCHAYVNILILRVHVTN